MAITEESRHGLYEGLIETLGQQRATTLMELLPPVGWADVATKRDIDQLHLDIDALRAATKKDLDHLQAATKKDLEQFQATTKRDIDELRVATKRDIDQVRLDIDNHRTATKKDLDHLQAATKKDLEQFQATTKRDIGQFRDETNTRFAQLEERTSAESKLVRMEVKSDVRASQVGVEQAMRQYFQTFLLAWLGSQVTFAGMVFAAIKFV